ncbi:hypothetical protein TRVL_06267 [Trypanosoma vivax]|nr:hypothetical protein TRVL_06267 [Trypanosoma vivax]
MVLPGIHSAELSQAVVFLPFPKLLGRYMMASGTVDGVAKQVGIAHGRRRGCGELRGCAATPQQGKGRNPVSCARLVLHTTLSTASPEQYLLANKCTMYDGFSVTT